MKKNRIRYAGPSVKVHDGRTAKTPGRAVGSALSFSDERRGSRHERGYGSAWDRLRKQILERDAYVCQCEDCAEHGLVKPANTVDHRIPKAQGGSDEPSNLRAMNDECHKRKTAREGLRGRS